MTTYCPLCELIMKPQKVANRTRLICACGYTELKENTHETIYAHLDQTEVDQRMLTIKEINTN